MQVIRVMRGILQCPCQPMPLLRRPLKPGGGGWAQVVVRVVALSPAPVCQFLRLSLKSLLSGRLCVGPHTGGQLSCCPASLWQPWRALPSPGRHRCPVQVAPSVQDSLPCQFLRRPCRRSCCGTCCRGAVSRCPARLGTYSRGLPFRPLVAVSVPVTCLLVCVARLPAWSIHVRSLASPFAALSSGHHPVVARHAPSAPAHSMHLPMPAIMHPHRPMELKPLPQAFLPSQAPPRLRARTRSCAVACHCPCLSLVIATALWIATLVCLQQPCPLPAALLLLPRKAPLRLHALRTRCCCTLSGPLSLPMLLLPCLSLAVRRPHFQSACHLLASASLLRQFHPLRCVSSCTAVMRCWPNGRPIFGQESFC